MVIITACYDLAYVLLYGFYASDNFVNVNAYAYACKVIHIIEYRRGVWDKRYKTFFAVSDRGRRNIS